MSNAYYNRLNSLRFYAVIAVLFSHFFNPNITKHLFLGNAGVNLFFVISGFLITEILLRYKHSSNSVSNSLKKFYVRRIIRIFPIYYLYLLVTAILYFSTLHEQLPWALSYTYNFYEQKYPIAPMYIHIWSLSIEEQFYLFWPLLILLIPNRFISKMILLVILVAIISRLSFPAFNHRLFTVSCLDAFGIGALFAYLKREKLALLQKILHIHFIWMAALLGFICMIIVSFWEIQMLDNWFRLIIAIISFYLIGICVFSDKIHKSVLWFFPEKGLINYLGVISYGIYIYHIMVAYLLDPFINDLLQKFIGKEDHFWKYLLYNSYLIKFPLYTAITVLVAILSYRLIEKPLLTLKDRLYKVNA